MTVPRPLALRCSLHAAWSHSERQEHFTGEVCTRSIIYSCQGSSELGCEPFSTCRCLRVQSRLCSRASTPQAPAGPSSPVHDADKGSVRNSSPSQVAPCFEALCLKLVTHATMDYAIGVVPRTSISLAALSLGLAVEPRAPGLHVPCLPIVGLPSDITAAYVNGGTCTCPSHTSVLSSHSAARQLATLVQLKCLCPSWEVGIFIPSAILPQLIRRSINSLANEDHQTTFFLT